MKILVAIDPGVSGGVAWNEPGRGITAAAMPEDREGMLTLARAICAPRREVYASTPLPRGLVAGVGIVEIQVEVVVYIEKVGGFIGGKGNTGSSMFTFGKAAGEIGMAFASCGAKLYEVHPTKWQNALHLKREKKMESDAWKRVLRDRAQREYPQLKATLKTADALLIHKFAEFYEPSRCLEEAA